MFYVLADTVSVFVATEWTEAKAGSFVLVPGHLTNDFEKPGLGRAGMRNVSAPGAFEDPMPGIAPWLTTHPVGDTHA